MRLVCIKEPEAEIVSLEEIKAYLKIDDDSEDALLLSLIKTARLYCENYQRVAYLPQTFLLTLAPGEWVSAIELPRTKYFSGVEEVVAVDSGGRETKIENVSAKYVGDINTVVSLPDAIPRNMSVMLTYCAGKEGVEPEELKTAVKLLVAGWYENRLPVSDKAVSSIPFGVHALLDPGRVPL